jgi:hypothetical protein
MCPNFIPFQKAHNFWKDKLGARFDSLQGRGHVLLENAVVRRVARIIANFDQVFNGPRNGTDRLREVGHRVPIFGLFVEDHQTGDLKIPNTRVLSGVNFFFDEEKGSF